MENNNQTLGGTRKSTPVDDEMTYPLTKDEYLTIQENLSISKFSNLEAFYISTFLTALVSGILTLYTGSFYYETTENAVLCTKINFSQIIIIIIYGVASFSCLFGFIISQVFKKKSKPAIKRLDDRITFHLNKTDK